MLHLFIKTYDLLLVGVYCSLLGNTKMQYIAKAIYFVCCVWFDFSVTWNIYFTIENNLLR